MNQNNKKKKILLHCNSIEHIDVAKSYVGRVTPRYDLFVLTSNYDFYRKIEGKYNSFYLEYDYCIPFEETYTMIDKINNRIEETCGSDIDPYYKPTYSYACHYVTERLSLLIMNLDSLKELLDKSDFELIYLFDDKFGYELNEALYLYYTSREKKIVVLNSKGPLTTLKYDGFDSEIDKYLSETAKYRKAERRKAVTREEIDIGFLYSVKQHSARHLEWSLNMLKFIGKNTRIISFSRNDDEEIFQENGYSTDCLEDYYNDNKYMNKIEGSMETIHKIERAIRKEKIYFIDIDIAPWILRKLFNYYQRELPEIIYFDVCAEQYFSVHRFGFIHIWGDSNFWETLVAYKRIGDRNTTFFMIKNPDLIRLQNRQSYVNIISWLFISEKERVIYDIDKSYEGKVCLVKTIFRYESKAGCDKNVCSNNSLNIAFLPTGLLKGYTTMKFYVGTLIPLLKSLTRKHKVLYKYHPGLNDYFNDYVKSYFDNNNSLIYYDSEVSATEVIRASDIVITDISTVVFDAICNKKIVLSITDNLGKRYIGNHEGGLMIFYSSEEILEFIDKILKDSVVREEYFRKEEVYLRKILGTDNINLQDGIKMMMENNRFKRRIK